MTARFMPAPHVRSVVHGDRTILLDLRRERYYSLDEVGTRVWALLGEGADVPTIVAQLAEEYEAPVEQIAADVDELLRQLTKQWKVVKPLVVPREPSVFVCALTLAIVTIALRVIGLRRSLAFAERLTRHADRAADPAPEFFDNVTRKVSVAATFFPGRALCLEHSLTLYTSLRRAGVMADLKLGAQPYPFAAHAWVEYRGELVGTTYDHVGKFVPFDRLAEAI